MDVSNDLFQIAGFFERYTRTGGVISPQEAQVLASRIGALAEGARGVAIALKAVCEEFDEYVASNGVAAGRPMRAFSVVEGGRA
jgi:hypothetical protein